MLAMASKKMESLLKYCQLMPHQYSLPLYFINEEPVAIQLLHLIITDTAAVSGDYIPELDVLLALARLCVKTGYTTICRSHVIPWANRWMRAHWDSLRADILYVVLLCNDRKPILETYKVFLLANLSDEEVCKADGLMDGIPETCEYIIWTPQLPMTYSC